MSVTNYREIGESLFTELLGLLRNNEHIALLGPRQGAKSLILERLQEKSQRPDLPERDRPYILRLIWDQFEAVSEDQFLAAFRSRLEQELDITLPPEPNPEGRLSGRMVDALAAAVSQTRYGLPVWLFFQDIIGFPKPIARQALEAIRAISYDDTLRHRTAVIVTGSSDFTHLTYGPNSPFNHARHFLIGGMDKAFAHTYFCERRAYTLGLFNPGAAQKFDCEEIEPAAFDYLYEQTGGNTHLIQELIVAVTRHPFNSVKIPMSRPWTLDETLRHIQHYRDTFMPFDHPLRITLREIEAEREAFDLLLKVLDAPDEVCVLAPGAEPGRLEVCGFVKRDGECVRISSPMLRDFLHRTLSPRHIGDVLASQRRWDEAWAQYRLLERGQAERSISGHPRFRLMQVLLDWQGYLLNQAHEGVESVVRHFLNGARYLLGFDHGGLYNPDTMQWILPLEGEPHSDLPTLGQPEPPPDSAKVVHYQGVPYQFDARRLRLWCDPGFKSRLPDKPRPALQLTREGEGREIDMGDRKLVLEALDQFWKAYRAAQEFEFYQKIGALRERHLRVMEAVNRELLSEPFDMGKVVQKTAEALVQEARYYRVLICLVDAKGERIQAVASACADPTKDFDRPTDFPLTDSDVQAWVCREKKPAVITDVRHPIQDGFTVQNDLADSLGMEAVTIVPMLDDNTVLGTLHFERADKKLPDNEELELYAIFAGQAAALFRQAQRLTLLQGAVDALDDSIAVLAPNNRLLFMNKTAAQSMDGVPGWQTDRMKHRWNAYEWASAPPEPDLMAQAQSDTPVHRYLTSDTERSRLQAGDWLMARITDFRGKLPERFHADATVGFVERFQDLSELYTLLNALQNWLQASNVEEIARSFLQIFRERGFSWARLYICNYKTHPAGENILESLWEFGIQDERKRKQFQSGKVHHVPERDPLPWHALKVARQPAIYTRDDALTTREIYAVPSGDGFPCYRTGPTPDDDLLERHHVRQWIEAPLRIGERSVGLLSLALPPEPFRSEQWELFNLLVQGAALALDHAIQTERVRRLAADAAKAEIASLIFHDLRTALTVCRGFVEAHQKAAREGTLTREKSVEWVGRLGAQLAQLEKVSTEYTRHVRGYSPDIQEGDLVARLREHCETISMTRPKLRCEFASEFETVPVLTDLNAIARAVDELIYNATKAGATQMRISVAGTPGDLVHILVEDNGPGVPETVRPRLFVPDVRKSKGGTGLGLAIVRDTIEALKGRIELQSSVPGRTVFLIALPRRFEE
jgi:signal transduction histidine kinase